MLVTLDKAVQLVLAVMFVCIDACLSWLGGAYSKTVYLGLVGHTLKPGLAPLAWTGLKLLRSSAS